MFAKFAFLLVLGLAFEKVYADEPESIVGGNDASLGEFPYQVSLRYYGQHICGGSIVSERHIITAAHCVEEIVNRYDIDKFHIFTGAVELDSAQGLYHRVKSIRIHPGYIGDRAYAWVNDAAVVTLVNPIQFNENRKPIPLATSDPREGAPLVFSGWGQTSTNGKIPNHLQKTMLFYVSNNQCLDAHPLMRITSSHLCAFRTVGIGACTGDSGGPLVYNGQLIGIASWVLPCALGTPDAFTRVSALGSFFSEAMRS